MLHKRCRPDRGPPRRASVAQLPPRLRGLPGVVLPHSAAWPPTTLAFPSPRPAPPPPPAVALVLGFVGVKILADFGGYHISTGASLGVVAGILGLGVGTSLLLPAPADEAAK